MSTVKPGFKNCQDKNLIDFKNQITIYQLLNFGIKNGNDKNLIDFKNQNGTYKKGS